MVLHSFVAIRGLLVGREEILKVLADDGTWPDVLKTIKAYSPKFSLPAPEPREIKETNYGKSLKLGTMEPDVVIREERVAYLKSYLDWNSYDLNDYTDPSEAFQILCEHCERSFVHTWRCCSSLSHKKFILGTEVEFIPDVWRVNEAILTLDSIMPQGFDDKEIIQEITSHGITVEYWQLQTFILPDDCSSCS